MSEVIKFNKYTTVVKIPLKELKRIEVIMGAQPRETMNSVFNRLNPKPDYLVNGGLFNMSNGNTMSTTIDNGKKYAEGYFSNFGLWTDKDGKFGFDYIKLGPDLVDFIGGSPSLIINDFVNLDTKGLDSSFLKGLHPRSAIGMNTDNFYIAAIDGRRSWARGMSCSELAQFMKDKLDCRYAINLDGGGSTRLGRNAGGKLTILNSPTENRAVDNFIGFYLNREKDLRVVTAYRLNIRKSPMGTILGTYSKETIVEVLETDSGWCRTEKGWVSEKYLRKI